MLGYCSKHQNVNKYLNEDRNNSIKVEIVLTSNCNVLVSRLRLTSQRLTRSNLHYKPDSHLDIFIKSAVWIKSSLIEYISVTINNKYAENWLSLHENIMCVSDLL